VTVEDLRAPPVNPGSEEAARARSPRRIRAVEVRTYSAQVYTEPGSYDER
jgi:hypothetical protein